MAPKFGNNMSEESIKRVLLVTFSHVGRNIFCTPAIRLIRRRWPEGEICALARSSRGAAVFARNPDIDLIKIARNSMTMRMLGRRSDYIIGLCGSSKRLAFNGLGVPVLWIGPSSKEKLRADELLDFVSTELDVPVHEEDRRYVLVPSDDDYANASALLSKSDDTYWMGIHLGSGRTRSHGWKFWYKDREKDARLWGVPHYIELAKILHKSHPRLRIILTGSRTERFLVDRFCEHLPDAISAVGKTTVLELAALMTKLKVFVTQNTGPLHIAAAMGTPLVALFAASDPKLTGPYPPNKDYHVVQGSTIEQISPQDIAQVVEKYIVG